MSTPPDVVVKILDTFINTAFKSPYAASGGKDWDPEIQSVGLFGSLPDEVHIVDGWLWPIFGPKQPQPLDSFLDSSLPEMAQIGKSSSVGEQPSCAICSLAKNREYAPVEIMPRRSIKIVNCVIDIWFGLLPPLMQFKEWNVDNEADTW
ncbi:hypothetical protein Dimus_031675 [Dionaea muscipula]